MEYILLYSTPLHNIRIVRFESKKDVLDGFKQNPSYHQGVLLSDVLYNAYRHRGYDNNIIFTHFGGI